MALTVAQAFTVAFELWQEAKEGWKRWRSWVNCDCRFSTADGENQLLSPDLCVVPLGSCLCVLEKGKRAKSGSAGEASSSSHSEKSNSLGSLKGGTNSMFHVSSMTTQHPGSSKDYFQLLMLVMNLTRMSYNICTLVFLICQISLQTPCWTWRTL